MQDTAPGLAMLKEIVGLSRALEMMLSGEMVDAAEAERIGLVSRVIPQERLLDEAKELARKLMRRATGTAGNQKKRVQGYL